MVNGSSGIAVGLATNILPHNLSETIDGSLAILKNPEISIDELVTIIPGPDFPTGGIINGKAGAIEAAKTGRGKVVLRAKVEIENEKNEKSRLIISEIPYQVNKANLVEKIADLSKDKKIDGISEIRDESDREGVRIVIDLKAGQNPEVILNLSLIHI